jgi:hypothetical protein
MTRPRLRRLAFVVQDAKRMASFYVEQFGMDLFHTDPAGTPSFGHRCQRAVRVLEK